MASVNRSLTLAISDIVTCVSQRSKKCDGEISRREKKSIHVSISPSETSRKRKIFTTTKCKVTLDTGHSLVY